MSYLGTDTTAISGLSSAEANEPADIRNGNSAAKSAYTEGLAFEQILVDQLVQTMTSNISDSSDSASAGGTDGSSDGTDQTGLLAGGGSSTGAYSSLMTGALTDSIMGGGGLGIASEIAQDIDPQIGTAAGEASTSTSGNSTTSASTGAVAA